jgi:hypothetical protein
MARLRSVLLCAFAVAACKRSRLIRSFVLLVAVLAANEASGAPAYPVSARLALAPQEDQRCLSLPDGTDCAIVEASRAAFAAVLSRMFRTSAKPDLQLVLSVKSADFSRWASTQLELVVRVRVLTPEGGLVDELEAYGSAATLVLEPEAIARARAVAAQEAANDFERRYANSTKIGDYLVSKKIAPASAVAVPERSDKLITFAAGLGLVQGGGDDGVAIAPTVRIAVSNRWLFIQAMYSRYTSSFQGVYISPGRLTQALDADLATNDLGLEAGAVIRFTPTVELRFGPGLHYLSGDGSIDPGDGGPTNSSSYSTVCPTFLASISSSFIPVHNGPRFLTGLEARAYFFSSVDLPELLRTVPTAKTSFALFLGVELPWDKKRSAP